MGGHKGAKISYIAIYIYPRHQSWPSLKCIGSHFRTRCRRFFLGQGPGCLLNHFRCRPFLPPPGGIWKCRCLSNFGSPQRVEAAPSTLSSPSSYTPLSPPVHRAPSPFLPPPQPSPFISYPFPFSRVTLSHTFAPSSFRRFSL